MARTQAADYEQRREFIVDKAAELFALRGFNGSSVSDLAAACKISKPLIYHYYSSKEHILYEVMASHIDQLLQDVDDVLATDEAPIEQLRTLIRNFMVAYIGAANRQKVLLNELGSLPAEKRQVIVLKQRKIIEAVQQLVAQVNPTVATDSARARVQTMLLFGMINWTHTWFDPAGPVSPIEIADMSFDLIVRGIETPKKRSATNRTQSRPA